MLEEKYETQFSVGKRLFVISFISLFCELMIIRWLSTEVRMFAYFKNLPLIACFLGLGVGLMLSSKKSNWFVWSPLVLLYTSGLLILAIVLRITHLSFFPPDPSLMLFGTVYTWTPAAVAKAVLAMGSLFALIIALFVGLGQETARNFEKMPPLKAYSINVAGALLGVIVFSLLSFLGTDPGVWLVVVGAIFFVTYRKAASIALIVLGLSYTLFLGSYTGRCAYGSIYELSRWSPYYRIDVLTVKNKQGRSLTHHLSVNYDGFQSMIECRPEIIGEQHPILKKGLEEECKHYTYPFVAFGKPADKVLILGSGSGSDVAAALRCGARHVDAVDIDPVIVELGQQMHPEHPYASERVSIYIEDARTFLRNCRDRYDIIVLPALDSHTAFSAMSSLRTDNYIFTQESMNECAKLLSPQGILCTSFIAVPDWLWNRHYELVKTSPEETAIGFYNGGELPSGFIVSGPGVRGKTSKDLKISMKERKYQPSIQLPITTDDWPFLFLPDRCIPTMYFVPLIAAILGIIVVGYSQKRLGHINSYNMTMFGLGAGFMLLEVRSMAAISLLFGSTWLVNSIVIGAVMICILIANLIAAKIAEQKVALVLLALVLATVLVSMSFDPGSLISLGSNLGAVVGCVVFLTPLAFSAATFSLLFKHTSSANSTQALAFNLVGGVLGVCLEYSSMITGIHALGYIALALYAIVLLILIMRTRFDRNNEAVKREG